MTENTLFLLLLNDYYIHNIWDSIQLLTGSGCYKENLCFYSRHSLLHPFENVGTLSSIHKLLLDEQYVIKCKRLISPKDTFVSYLDFLCELNGQIFIYQLLLCASKIFLNIAFDLRRKKKPGQFLICKFVIIR